jgi:hypothetical protein
VESNFFINCIHLHFSPPIPHFALTLQPTCILLKALIASRSWLKARLSFQKPAHNECPQITYVAQAFKVLIYVYKELVLVLIQLIFMQDANIVEWTYISWIQIDEQSMMGDNLHVVHVIHFLPPIEPRLMNEIVLRFIHSMRVPSMTPIQPSNLGIWWARIACSS